MDVNGTVSPLPRLTFRKEASLASTPSVWKRRGPISIETLATLTIKAVQYQYFHSWSPTCSGSSSHFSDDVWKNRTSARVSLTDMVDGEAILRKHFFTVYHVMSKALAVFGGSRVYIKISALYFFCALRTSKLC